MVTYPLPPDRRLSGNSGSRRSPRCCSSPRWSILTLPPRSRGSTSTTCTELFGRKRSSPPRWPLGDVIWLGLRCAVHNTRTRIQTWGRNSKRRTHVWCRRAGPPGKKVLRRPVYRPARMTASCRLRDRCAACSTATTRGCSSRAACSGPGEAAEHPGRWFPRGGRGPACRDADGRGDRGTGSAPRAGVRLGVRRSSARSASGRCLCSPSRTPGHGSGPRWRRRPLGRLRRRPGGPSGGRGAQRRAALARSSRRLTQWERERATREDEPQARQRR